MGKTVFKQKIMKKSLMLVYLAVVMLISAIGFVACSKRSQFIMAILSSNVNLENEVCCLLISIGIWFQKHWLIILIIKRLVMDLKESNSFQVKNELDRIEVFQSVFGSNKLWNIDKHSSRNSEEKSKV